jgi:hypothetical protein
MAKRIIAGLTALVIGLVTATAGDDASQGDYRKWTDISGRYEIEAEFVEVKYDKEKTTTVVTLRKRDGSILNVDVARLSAASRRLAIRLNANQRAAVRREPPGKTAEKQSTPGQGEGIAAGVSESALPVFDVHFCVITKNKEAQAVATLEQLKKEVEILNKYSV